MHLLTQSIRRDAEKVVRSQRCRNSDTDNINLLNAQMHFVTFLLKF